MTIYSHKMYIDYLDYVMEGKSVCSDAQEWLRLDLLLFAEDTLCMSVPACIKLERTATTLMQLTPFWKNGRIRIILEQKHMHNPWRYFQKRESMLEKNFTEEKLLQHFEYSAYKSSHTKVFYDVFVKEVVQPTEKWYLPRVSDADIEFRTAVKKNTEFACNRVCNALPVGDALHMGKIFNDLTVLAENRRIFFQRSAIEGRLLQEFGASEYEIGCVRHILDRCFAYANAVAAGGVPISQIQNRLTGKMLLPILKYAEPSLWVKIRSLDFEGLYRLSNEAVWKSLRDRANSLFVFYRRRKNGEVLSEGQFKRSLAMADIFAALYALAKDSLRTKFAEAGAPPDDVFRMESYAQEFLKDYIKNEHAYWDTVRQIQELVPILSGVVDCIKEQCQPERKVFLEEGIEATLCQDI